MHSTQAKLSILSARGVACILLVAYHVVGSEPTVGLKLAEGSAWHYAMNSFEFLRMPLFSVLSGYLYAMRRPTRATLRLFAAGKFRRILLPLIFATLVTFWLRTLVYGPDVTLSHALLYHYQHFWFLQALLLIFAGMAIWDVLRPPTWCGLLVASIVAVMLERSIGLPDLLSINGAVYLLPFFCFGMILRLEPHLLENHKVRLISGVVLAVVIAAQQSGMIFGTTAVARNSVPAAMAGYSVSFLLLVYLPSLKLFEVVGRYSYAIYIWHSISGAAARTGLNSVVSVPVAAQFVVIGGAGILLPILLEQMIGRVPGASTVVLGKRRTSVNEARVAQG